MSAGIPRAVWYRASIRYIVGVRPLSSHQNQTHPAGSTTSDHTKSLHRPSRGVDEFSIEYPSCHRQQPLTPTTVCHRVRRIAFLHAPPGLRRSLWKQSLHYDNDLCPCLRHVALRATAALVISAPCQPLSSRPVTASVFELDALAFSRWSRRASVDRTRRLYSFQASASAVQRAARHGCSSASEAPWPRNCLDALRPRTRDGSRLVAIYGSPTVVGQASTAVHRIPIGHTACDLMTSTWH